MTESQQQEIKRIRIIEAKIMFVFVTLICIFGLGGLILTFFQMLFG